MKSANEGHWEFRSAQDVSRFWESVCTVPSRIDGRKHHDEERFCLGLYLRALAIHELLHFPFSVEQSEEHSSPDFILRWPSGESTGLEVTRATQESHQKAMTEGEREYRRRTVEARASGIPRKPVSIPLDQHGWLEGEAKAKWCSLFQTAIEEKLGKIRTSGLFKPASRHDLLVYDDTPLVGMDRQAVITLMEQWVRDLPQVETSFAQISIISSLDVIFDIGG